MYKGFFMENLYTHILQISNTNKCKSPDFYDKL
jgi:hypothetical protein